MNKEFIKVVQEVPPGDIYLKLSEIESLTIEDRVNRVNMASGAIHVITDASAEIIVRLLQSAQISRSEAA